MSYQFKSCLAIQLSDFVSMKKNLGFDYRTGQSYLHTIDKAMCKFKLRRPAINRKFYDFFLNEIEYKNKQNKYTYVRHLREFSVYLLDQGITSYLPSLLKYTKNDFIPHIYTEKQIKDIINAFDNIQIQPHSQANSPVFAFPALIRLLIATGIRTKEAVNLRFSEINFKKREILVTDAKNKLQRLIPISKELNDVLKDHAKSIDLFCPKQRPTDHFFINASGLKIGKQRLHCYFSNVLSTINIPYKGRGKGPRIHDFRHTFAVRSLENMMRKGVDPYVALPIIQQYLGHMDIKSTDTYLRLTEQFHSEIAAKLDKINYNVYPKLK
jgi:integrase/recombinase XerD